MLQRAPLVLIPFILLDTVGLAAPRGTRPMPSPRPSAAVAPGASPDMGKGATLRVLFLGNSLTAANDLPALIKAMAAAGGVRLEADACISGGSSLEDHWNRGSCRRMLAQGRWDYVVLQQGPSTLPESQVHLRQWGRRWAEEARKHGAKTAFYMVWPQENQRNGFELVSQSYRQASIAAGGLLLPTGDAWKSVIRRGGIALYQPDGLHPTLAGTYLAALVITQGLTGVSPGAVPARLTLASGRKVELPGDRVRLLQAAAEEVAPRPKS